MSETHDAAAIVQAAETAALTALYEAVNAFDAAIKSATADLDYPDGFASNAKRIASNLSVALWPKNELASLLGKVDAVTTPAGPSA